MLLRRRNSPALSDLCSYEIQVETSLSSFSHTCTELDIPIAREVDEKELKNLLKLGKFSFYVMLDCDIFT